MNSTYVRITAITLDNFKNVGHGELRLNNPKQNFPCSVLGLYGQNGSGKTALIEAVGLLKTLLSRDALADNVGETIRVGTEAARIAFEFQIADKNDEEPPITVFYEFQIKRSRPEPDPISGQTSSDSASLALVTDEKLSAVLPLSNGIKRRLSLIDSSNGDPFTPVEKVKQLIGASAEDKKTLSLVKTLAQDKRQTFVFSYKLQQLIEAESARSLHCELSKTVLRLMNRLRLWAHEELFLYTTAQAGLISLDTLPLWMKETGDNARPTVTGNVLLPLNQAFSLPVELLDIIDRVLACINLVLVQIVPGLTIGLARLQTALNAQGQKVADVELVSNKNQCPIPLRYESEGIKKIISVLHLLISVFNERTVTVAIDELDSGIFEYLLGELLRIISSRGRGQLIFTSHNLRALETMDKAFTAFTSTDTNNRYLRLKNIKTTNNLRDTYFRDLMLGDNSELLYNMTNNAKIALAMRDAAPRHV